MIILISLQICILQCKRVALRPTGFLCHEAETASFIEPADLGVLGRGHITGLHGNHTLFTQQGEGIFQESRLYAFAENPATQQECVDGGAVEENATGYSA